MCRMRETTTEYDMVNTRVRGLPVRGHRLPEVKLISDTAITLDEVTATELLYCSTYG